MKTSTRSRRTSRNVVAKKNGFFDCTSRTRFFLVPFFIRLNRVVLQVPLLNMFLVRNGGRVAARTCNTAVLNSSVQQVAFRRQQKQMSTCTTASFFNLRRVGGGAAALLAIGAGAGAVAESAPKESVKAVKFSTQATAETALEARYDMYVQQTVTTNSSWLHECSFFFFFFFFLAV